MTTPATSIDAVASAFESWLKVRPCSRTRTPEALRRQIINLLECHSRKDVVAKLGISITTLNRWLKAERPHADSSHTEFISLPTPLVRDLSSSQACESDLHLTLKYPSGIELRLQGSITTQHLSAVVQCVASLPETLS